MKGMSQEEVRRLSERVCENALHGYDWSRVRHVLAYKPIAGSGEVDPGYLLNILVDSANVEYVETDKNAPLPAGIFDVIIVPVVGYNDSRYRLGRGGGWYDRLLALHPETVGIGFAYSWANVDFDAEPHDISVSYIFTD